ncbi:MAG: hypothetical protein H0X27_11905 [Caulobacteraceae bacterium]|nr:hypothetical protein [Caulobacteraceae bacterium]
MRAARATPPRLPIVFRVGVVGHRPDRLPQDNGGLEAVRARLAQALGAVADAVADFEKNPDARFYAAGEAPCLRANSPLAEGADRLFAEEALRLGYELCCIMPFAQAEYEQDFQSASSFESDSLARFKALLTQAAAIGGLTRFQLDGRRDRHDEAYEAAGCVVLNQSDLLVAVWDGGASRGTGGTVDTLRQALDLGVPTLWIDSRAPHGWKLLRRSEDLDCVDSEGNCVAAPIDIEPAEDERRLRDALLEVVKAELGLPPPESAEDTTRARLGDYNAERKPRWNLAFIWKLSRDFLGGAGLRLPPLRVPDFVDQIRAEWPVLNDPTADGCPQPTPAISWINAALRSRYAWADKLADRYADAHRSAFVWSSLLAAGAVLTALLPVAAHFQHRPFLTAAFVVVDAVILIFMVAIPYLARKRRWHQRWTEYRVLAELIRELRILIPLGRGRPLPRAATHLANYGDPTRSWMYWRMRAIARAVGLPDARVDGAYIREQLEHLLDFIGVASDTGIAARGQLGFHEVNCQRMSTIHHRLHRWALTLFGVTIAGVVLNWLLPMVAPLDMAFVTPWLILISVFLPALGAALASINNQGEFARLQKRSRAMAEGFEAMRLRIVALSGQATAPRLEAVTELAAQIAAMMVEENVDWRIVVLDLPHVAG